MNQRKRILMFEKQKQEKITTEFLQFVHIRILEIERKRKKQHFVS